MQTSLSNDQRQTSCTQRDIWVTRHGLHVGQGGKPILTRDEYEPCLVLWHWCPNQSYPANDERDYRHRSTRESRYVSRQVGQSKVQGCLRGANGLQEIWMGDCHWWKE